MQKVLWVGQHKWKHDCSVRLFYNTIFIDLHSIFLFSNQEIRSVECLLYYLKMSTTTEQQQQQPLFADSRVKQ